MDYFFGLGFDAYEAGHPRAPMFNAEMCEALKGAIVGDPFNLEIMGAFTRGWDSAADNAAILALSS